MTDKIRTRRDTQERLSDVVGVRAERLSRDAGKGKLTWDKARVKRLFRRYKERGDTDAREQLVVMHLNLVLFLASRFKNRGEPLDDLIQVGNLGLIKSIDRFDPARGLEFATYATPTILGEIKRHFRDKGWSIRVPRRLQELSAKVNKVTEELTGELQRSPKLTEIAERLEVSVDEVLEAMESSSAYNSVSLDDNTSRDEDALSIIDTIKVGDKNLASSDDRMILSQAISSFPEKERQVIKMRFIEGYTQAEIAERLGVSQVQVSRFLRKTLAELREKINIDFN